MQVEAMLQEFAQPVLNSLSELLISSGHNQRKGATLTPLSSSAHSTCDTGAERGYCVIFSFFFCTRALFLMDKGACRFLFFKLALIVLSHPPL